MIRRTTRSTSTDTRLPCTTLFRSFGLRQGELLVLGRIEPRAEEGDLELGVRIDRAGAFHEGVEQAVHLADGMAADHADLAGFGQGAGEHAHQIAGLVDRSEEHTSELQSLMRNSYAVFCLKMNKNIKIAARLSTLRVKKKKLHN